MNKGEKLLSLVLTGMLSFTALTGCNPGGNTGGYEAKSIRSSEDSGAEQTHETAESALTYNGQDVSEFVELVMYYIGDSAEDEALVLAEINKKLKEKINATLVLKDISLSDYTTKYALTIAGGEAIDLIYTSTWAFYQSEANKGAFAEVTDQVLSNYMPMHKENQAEASWGQAKLGEKVYFVPCNLAAVSANSYLIRGDLRKKYGMEKPDSIQELEKYYTAVTEDPDSGVTFAYHAAQNNDNSKYILLQAENDWVGFAGTLLNYAAYRYTDDVSADDLFWLYDTQEYLEYAKLMKEWADKGFWSKSAIANATDVKESFTNGTSASFTQNMGTLGTTAAAVAKEHPEWEPEICDVTPHANRFFGGYTGDGIAVLANSQNQERAFMALDVLKFDEDVYNLVRHGIEGVHYEVNPDGKWKPGPENEKYPFDKGLSWGLKNSQYEMTRDDIFPDQEEITAKWEERAVDALISAFSFDDTNVKNELANLQSVYTQYIPLIDLGLVDDVEKTLDEFNQKAEAAGKQKIIDEARRQLSVYLKGIKNQQ